jgi:hypothetical protein
VFSVRLWRSHLHLATRCELHTHVNQRGLHIISSVAHGSGAVRETGLLQALQRSLEQARNHWLCLAALCHECRGRGGGCGWLVSFVLRGISRHPDDRTQAEAEEKSAGTHCSLLPIRDAASRI